MLQTIAAYLLLLQVATVSPPPDAKATIEGVVLRAGTTQPVMDARVTLSATEVYVTGRNGRFAFRNLDAGPYQLMIEGDGYIRQRKTFTLSGGETAAMEIQVQLTPTGNVTGRVLDSSGHPVISVPVQLVNYTYNEFGHRTFRVASKTKTNDRGEYRLYWVTPGSYYLMAGAASPFEGFFDAVNLNEVPQPTGFAYYPGVIDINYAVAIEIAPGAELNGLDVLLQRQSYSIRGEIIESGTGRPPASAVIAVVPDGAPSVTFDAGDEFPRGRYDATNGTFEIRDVASGTHYISVTSTAATRGSLAVTVSNSDVDGIRVITSPPFSVRGRLRLEGPLPEGISPDGLNIQLVPATSASLMQLRQVRTERSKISAGIGPGGNFQIDSVSAGSYRLMVAPGIENVFIKEARLNGADVLSVPLRLNGPPASPLEIVVSSNGAQVTGIVSDDANQPAGVRQVVLVPDTARDRPDLYKTVISDADGGFTITGIAPGDYRLFSWESSDRNSWLDPQRLRRQETKGTAIRLVESSTARVDVKMIPAGDRR